MAGHTSYAKPQNDPDFHAEYFASVGWRVVSRMGEPVGDVQPSKQAAHAAAGARNSAANRAKGKKDRPCLCCQTVFPSEGIHNRLCPRCRHAGSAEAMPAGYSFGSMNGRRRA